MKNTSLIRNLGAAALLAMLATNAAAAPLGPSFIYDDAVQNNWFNNPFAATMDPNHTATVKNGTKSIAAAITGGAVQFNHTGTQVDTTPFESLSFWVHGGATGGHKLQVTLMKNLTDGPRVDVLPDTGAWKQVTIPLASLGAANATTVDGMRIWEGNGVSSTFHLDDIQFNRPATYTLTYNGNGNTAGTAPAATAAEPGADITVSDAGSLARTDYEFIGWNAKANGTGMFYAADATLSISANTTLYAQWNYIGTTFHTVTYAGNGNTSGDPPYDNLSPYIPASTVTVLGNTEAMTKDGGFVFAGWNTATNGGGTHYAAGATFSITGDVTLYAKWVTPVTLTYIGNGNTDGNAPTDANSPYVPGATVTVLGNTGNLTKTGGNFIFAGWNTATDGSGTNYLAGATFAMLSDTILYAKWADIGADATWDGGGADTNWQTADNWNPNGTPANDGTARLIFTGSTRPSTTNNFTADTTFNGFTFDAAAAAFTLAGNAVTLGGNIGFSGNPTAARTHTISLPLTVNATRSITTETNGSVTVSGIVSGSGGLSKAGNGTLLLSGANTFAGGVTLNAGRLNLNHATALGAATGVFTVENGTTLDSPTANLALTANNPVVINGDFTFTGTKQLNLGKGATTLGTAAGTTRTITTNSGNPLTLGGLADGTTAINLTKVGTGRVDVVTNQPSLLTGKITTSGGSFIISNTNTSAPLSVPAAIQINGAATRFQTGDSGPTVGISNYSGTIAGDGLFRIFTSSQTVLHADNSGFTGAMHVYRFAKLAHAKGLGSGTVSLDRSYENAYLDLNGLAVTGINAEFTNREQASPGTRQARLRNTNTAAAASFAGNITTVNSNNVGVDGAGDMTLGGVISGSNGLTKYDAGTLTLTNANTYIGVTSVAGGTLVISGNHSAATGVVFANNGGTLAGTGSLGGNVTIQSGGHQLFAVAATTGAQATRTISGSLTLDAGHIIDLTAAAPPAAGSYTLVTATGGITGEVGTVNLTGLSGTVAKVGNSLVLTATAGGSDYDAWKAATGVTGGPADDDDGDGVKNFDEYAFGLNPQSGASASPISSPFNKATGIFKYTRRKQSLTGLTYTYESSTTLADAWPIFTPDSEISNNGDPVEEITVDVPNALLANPALFIRVKAVQP